MSITSIGHAIEETSLASICTDREKLRQAFDLEPTGFSHTLSGLTVFTLDSLHRLAEKMADHPSDYFIAASAPSPETKFYSVPSPAYRPPEAIENLNTGAYRILLKRAETHDSLYMDLLNTLFRQVVDMLGGLGRQKIVRLESGILISSAATITPFHYDEEIGFFSQIEGDKTYHVYSPTVIHEPELERFSVQGGAVLAPVELQGRDPDREYVFNLKPGRGFHQPRFSPHWVETGASRSISYTFVFETNATRAVRRTRAFNRYMRQLGLSPAAVGAHPTTDRIKSDTMLGVIPVHRRADWLLNKIRPR
jgi:hypothetical protein